MSAIQHPASRLETHSASEPKIGLQKEQRGEGTQEQVLSSNSATTTAKKGIAPMYIDEKVGAEKSPGNTTQKPGSGQPKKKQGAAAQSRIQSGKVKLKPRATQHASTKARAEDAEAA